jgi:hypothetical protein
MGLDMYAITRSGTLPADVDFAEEESDAKLHYWRKHPNLHGWMEQLYREKGGNEPDFNCVPVALTDDDLRRLEVDIRAGLLPSTSGFFFGASNGSERNDDLAFVAKARNALSAGLAVYYTSWW